MIRDAIHEAEVTVVCRDHPSNLITEDERVMVGIEGRCAVSVRTEREGVDLSISANDFRCTLSMRWDDLMRVLHADLQNRLAVEPDAITELSSASDGSTVMTRWDRIMAWLRMVVR